MIVQFKEGDDIEEYRKILKAKKERDEALLEYYEQTSEDRVARFILPSN